ncbi:MAG: polysaccharide deacetylase family protein [Candidatus Firestonebacteria bacterium]|nr:polysaccharide deacetylase family protein [Candidatus Firestonebacteria bacterium]
MKKYKLYFLRSLILLILVGILFIAVNLFSLMFPAVEIAVAVQKKSPAHIKAIALTFDDGPHPGYTLKILRVLEKSKIKATFFVVGKQVRKYSEFLREIAIQGHEIGNHTFNHPLLTILEPQAIADELEMNKAEIKKATGIDVAIFRPPSGRYNKKVLEAALNRSFIPVLWSVSGSDYGATDPKAVFLKTLSSLQDGDIILLHSGVDATLQALPEIIAEIKKRGFEFKTVSGLLDTADIPAGNYIYKNYKASIGDKR